MDDNEDSNDELLLMSGSDNGEHDHSESESLSEHEITDDSEKEEDIHTTNLGDDSENEEGVNPSNLVNEPEKEEMTTSKPENDSKEGTNPTQKVLGETKPLSEEAIAEYNAKLKRTGVVYLSSIPPYMNWSKVMSLLGQFGEINRSHLVEEDKSITRRRKRSGGSAKVCFKEGWVEFVNKRDAKTAVAQLNGRIVGGKKNNFFHDYIWTMKYLHGFKWSQLMELMDYEKRVRQDKLKVEFARSRKEDEKYLENAAKSQRIKKMQEKRKEKAEKKETMEK